MTEEYVLGLQRGPWWRRLLCACGWHLLIAIDYSHLFGALLRCRYCGTDDYEEDFVKLPRCVARWRSRL